MVIVAKSTRKGSEPQHALPEQWIQAKSQVQQGNDLLVDSKREEIQVGGFQYLDLA